MLHQIGVGTLGPVFRTYEPSRDRLVAVKVFRLDITPEQAQSLADELASSAEAGLFHPSIVEPIAAGVQGTVAYRADEYVAAESLDVAMRHYAPATLDKVLPFITQLAGAIDFARAAGVGHGALHPRDIFVTPDEARATGFGVVDALERLKLRAPVRRPYSAPERIAGESWGTPADVFSLAVIAFELLTGRRPAGVGEQMGSLAGAMVGDAADPLRAVLARAMSEKPADRYPDALAFAGALEAAARPGARVPASAGPSIVAIPPAQPATRGRSEAPPPLRPVEVPPPVVASTTGGQEAEDDIESERAEDEAHWALSREELTDAATEPESEESDHLFEDEEVEAAADRLVFDAADLALMPKDRDADRFVEEFHRPGVEEFRRPGEDALTEKEADSEAAATLPPPPPREPEDRSRRIAPIAVPVRTPEPRSPAPAPVRREEPVARFGTLLGDSADTETREGVERSRFPVLPIAVGVIVGLLLGFGLGHTVGTRGARTETIAQPAGSAESSAPSTDPAGPSASAGSGQPAKPFTEGTVSPPPGSPAAPPNVPADTPAVKPPAESARTPAQAPRSGKLMVRSTPSGASVTINGRWRGRTPLTLSDLAFGDYVVRVVTPGYDVAREEFTLSSTDASRNVSVRLQREPRAAPAPSSARANTNVQPSGPRTFSGSIFVDSRPRGARVFIDGKEVGTTPMRVPEVGIGAHVIRLELADHRIWSNSVRVASGEEARVTGSLEPMIR